MNASISVNNPESELSRNYISPEIVCRPADKILETNLNEDKFFINKSYTITKEENKDSNANIISVISWEFIDVKKFTQNELSLSLWDDYLESKYEYYEFEEKPLKKAKKQFTTYFGKICKKIKKLVYYQNNLEKTYFNARDGEFVFWYDDFSVVHNLVNFNSQMYDILFQCLTGGSQQQSGPVKGWVLDITRIRNSRAKWVYALSQNIPLVNNGLNRISEVLQRFQVCVRTHRDTLTTCIRRSIAKCFVKLKNGIRSVEDVKNGDKEKSDSKGQRLGISQTTYSRYYAWT